MVRGLVPVDRAESGKPFEPIVRDRIISRLTEASAHRITIVVAPAGFGKSVAVRHFLEAIKIRHLRYALHAEHASLLGFARGLAEALKSVLPGMLNSIADAYEKAAKGQAPAMELAAWAHSHIKEYGGTIVIDDFHEAVDPLVCPFLTELIKRTQEPTRWMIVTRETLELPVASWMAYGYMDVPIDDSDLKITFDEAEELVRSVGIVIRQEDLITLLELTGGWPVAFVFALRASTRTNDFQRVAGGTREMVYEFLAEQIFRKLREDERNFLLDTCVFSAVDVTQLARHGRPRAKALIVDLRKHTAFISVEEEDRLYRYHELFRQYLLRELEKLGVDELQKRQSAAGVICEEESSFSEALALYTAAGASDRIERLLERVGFDFLEVGRRDLVEAALAVLPEFVRRQNPKLLALRGAQEFLLGRYDRSDACYDEALRLASGDTVRGAIVHRYAQSTASRFVWEKCVELIEGYGLEKAEDARIQARMLGTVACAYCHVESQKSPEPFISKALDLVATIDDESLRATILHQAGFIAFVKGEYERAESYARTVIEIAERHDFNGIAGRSAAVIAAILEERGDISQRLSLLGKMGVYAERAGDFQFAFRVVADTYVIEVERGAIERVAALGRELSRFDVRGLPLASQELLSSFALQAAWNADFLTALQMLEGSLESQITGSHRALRWAEIAVYAVSAGEREKAEDAVNRVIEELRGVEEREEAVTHYTLRARIWLALTQLLLGRASSANNILALLESGKLKKFPPIARFLLAAVRAIYVHLETGAGYEEMGKALDELRQANYGGYAALLDALPLPTRCESSPFGLLTKTELAILRALATGKSSRSIGEEMERSALTIDTHVKSIVRKLGCKGRRQAVSLARQHGIV